MVGTYELFSAASLALATGAEPPAPLEQLWDGLEVFVAYPEQAGDIEPAPLAAAAAAALGIAPDASGLVDHASIGDQWERTGGATSIIAGLLAQLRT
jgi:hypothetical protein